eukprot:CAMPEP_0184493636 /NCGR_PEP_ID=MMETSP0113_2-20130426/26582_1 /TAXON_ID=91329 /ORGANISM="Norrisiella sphaerica, Strain BC52" /LENGTH=264 /DNA_ID=CAMNT_0026878971 /DNA_START=57 /DNA_END=847 /DNA_ORIENTATION=+
MDAKDVKLKPLMEKEIARNALFNSSEEAAKKENSTLEGKISSHVDNSAPILLAQSEDEGKKIEGTADNKHTSQLDATNTDILATRKDGNETDDAKKGIAESEYGAGDDVKPQSDRMRPRSGRLEQNENQKEGKGSKVNAEDDSVGRPEPQTWSQTRVNYPMQVVTKSIRNEKGEETGRETRFFWCGGHTKNSKYGAIEVSGSRKDDDGNGYYAYAGIYNDKAMYTKGEWVFLLECKEGTRCRKELRCGKKVKYHSKWEEIGNVR